MGRSCCVACALDEAAKLFHHCCCCLCCLLVLPVLLLLLLLLMLLLPMMMAMVLLLLLVEKDTGLWVPPHHPVFLASFEPSLCLTRLPPTLCPMHQRQGSVQLRWLLVLQATVLTATLHVSKLWHWCCCGCCDYNTSCRQPASATSWRCCRMFESPQHGIVHAPNFANFGVVGT